MRELRSDRMEIENTLEDAPVSELSPRAYLLNVRRTQKRTAIPPGNKPLPGRRWCVKHGLIGNIGSFYPFPGNYFAWHLPQHSRVSSKDGHVLPNLQLVKEYSPRS